MTSLRKYGDELAKVLGSTSAAIYERQRLAVRIGLIELAGSRGPGGGTQASPETVAALLICYVCANGPEPEAHSKDIAGARATTKGNILKADTFLAALAILLGSTELASKTLAVRIAQLDGKATIEFKNSPPLIFHGQLRSAYAIHFDVKLSGVLIQFIAGDLSRFVTTQLSRRKSVRRTMK